MRMVCGCLLVMLWPAVAYAQPRAYPVWERPAAGFFLGSAINGDRNSGGSAPEASFVFDTPVVFGHRVRADVSRVSWRFEDRDSHDVVIARDTVTLKSIRVNVLGVVRPGPRTAGYGGVGYGVYRYEYASSPLRHPWRDGVNVVAGLEHIMAGQRYAIDGEVRVEAIKGSGIPPVFSVVLFRAAAAVGMKMRF